VGVEGAIIERMGVGGASSCSKLYVIVSRSAVRRGGGEGGGLVLPFRIETSKIRHDHVIRLPQAGSANCAGHRSNGELGSNYAVFSYMGHDLNSILVHCGHRLTGYCLRVLSKSVVYCATHGSASS